MTGSNGPRLMLQREEKDPQGYDIGLNLEEIPPQFQLK